MNVLIRCDASPQIGLGHLMRCLALANTMRGQGFHVYFVLYDPSGVGAAMLNDQNMPMHLMPFAFSNWENDAERTIYFIEEMQQTLDWLIVDHYDLDAQWETALKPHTQKILVIDDLANRSHECHVLLDQNTYAHPKARYEAYIPPKTKILCGPEFALLRKEFEQYRPQTSLRTKVKTLLILFGGGDSSSEIEKALIAVRHLKLNNINVNVVINRHCKHQTKITELCSNIPNTNLLSQPNDIAKLMAEADLCIGAGGISNWERCCLGLPSLVMTVAANQIGSTEEADRIGALEYLGHSSEVTIKMMMQALSGFIQDENRLSAMSNKAMKLVDGKGCERVINQLVQR